MRICWLVVAVWALVLAPPSTAALVLPADASKCSAAALASYAETFQSMGTGPCGKKPIMYSIPAGCATWLATPSGPAPLAPYIPSVHFGKCNMKSPNGDLCASTGSWTKGECVNVEHWCHSDYFPLADKTAAPPVDADAPSAPHCCCFSACAAGVDGKTVINPAQINEDSMRDRKSLDDLSDAAPYSFKTDAKAFISALDAAGVARSISNTRRPHVKAMVMHVVSCIAKGCPKKGLGTVQCNPVFCAKDSNGNRDWKAIDAAALEAVRAAGSDKAAVEVRWTPAEVNSVLAYMDEHTFACANPWTTDSDGKAAVDPAGSLVNYQELNSKFSFKHAASITSFHISGRAIDMRLTSAKAFSIPLGPKCEWLGTLRCSVPQCDTRGFTATLSKICNPLTSQCSLPAKSDSYTSSDLAAVGCSYGVVKFKYDPATQPDKDDDNPHWSVNGG